jgi:6-phosphogluconolactonase
MQMQSVSRRRFLAGATAAVFSSQIRRAVGRTGDNLLFVGTGTKKGIFAYHWQPTTGELRPAGLAVETPFPGFLAWAPGKQHLYSVNSLQKVEGTISGFQRNGSRLTLINTVSSGGVDPCHIAVDATGHAVFTANYGSGSIASYTADASGKLSGPISRFQADGHGPNSERQEGPHAHRVTPSPDNRFLYVNDLGRDRIDIYRLTAATAELTKTGEWIDKPGSGPRSLRFHPNGKIAYCVNELNSTVEVLSWDKSTGDFTSVQHVDLLPEGHTGPTRGCESALTRRGDFAYFANRDFNFLASFRCDPATGKLTFLKRSSCGGKIPRHIALDPSEHWLLVANQDSNGIAIFSRNPSTGELAENGEIVELEIPMCLLFD